MSEIIRRFEFESYNIEAYVKEILVMSFNDCIWKSEPLLMYHYMVIYVVVLSLTAGQGDSDFSNGLLN
jgi:hypothetical protein